MIQLTVGYVAGIIAAAMFIARILSPNTLTLILSGLLRDRNSAATWTLAGRAFQRSYWPLVLRADSAYKKGVPKRIVLLSRVITAMGGLIAIAGVVTPLGLYEALVPADNIQTPFQYLSDSSPFGYGTPPRSNYSFTRTCTDQSGFGLIPCPFTDTVAIINYNSDGDANYSFPYSYDLSIPDVLMNTYSSGTDGNTTVSNFFDIQYRRYLTTTSDTFNNGSRYLVGSFRNMQSIVLNNAYQPVEGLVTDTKNGGIGFRNHTVPPGFQYGVTWEEDLLFIEPETVCVDTNLTLDFTISSSPNGTSSIVTGVVLTDRGGFINMNHTFPEPDIINPQNNSDLYGRAYKAAWLNNAFTALYYNVTDTNNATTGAKAWSYVNSFVGKTFAIPSPEFGVSSAYDSLFMTTTFGDYLQLDLLGSQTNNSAPSDSGLSTNPFNVNSTSFTSISIECATAGGLDFANITNIFIACGMMHGVPQRRDGGSPLVFDSGSSWSQPLYTCASAIKASQKTVSFNYNGTQGLLENLNITDIRPKAYPDDSHLPLWGVENTGNEFDMESISLIWGLVSSTYENNPNVSTVHQESLYLPGYNSIGSGLAGSTTVENHNLPGSDFFAAAMGTAYNVDATSSGVIDYTGETNMAMWAHWQNLTQSAQTAALIPNLIWTDNAASAVVGTKGVLGPMNAARQNAVALQVTPTVSKIKYHYLFAIPALIAAVGLVLIAFIAFVIILIGRGGPGRMRLHLQQVSPGRIYTAFLYPGPGSLTMRSRVWSKALGQKLVDLSGEFPMAGDMIQPPDKGPIVTEYQRTASDDRSAEHDGFLRHGRERSEGDIGGYGFAGPQQYGIART